MTLGNDESGTSERARELRGLRLLRRRGSTDSTASADGPSASSGRLMASDWSTEAAAVEPYVVGVRSGWR